MKQPVKTRSGRVLTLHRSLQGAVVAGSLRLARQRGACVYQTRIWP